MNSAPHNMLFYPTSRSTHVLLHYATCSENRASQRSHSSHIADEAKQGGKLCKATCIWAGRALIQRWYELMAWQPSPEQIKHQRCTQQKTTAQQEHEQTGFNIAPRKMTSYLTWAVTDRCSLNAQPATCRQQANSQLAELCIADHCDNTHKATSFSEFRLAWVDKRVVDCIPPPGCLLTSESTWSWTACTACRRAGEQETRDERHLDRSAWKEISQHTECCDTCWSLKSTYANLLSKPEG